MMDKSHLELDPITVLNIATNVYFDYWKELILSADAFTSSEEKVSFWLFTDRVDEAHLFAKKIKNLNMRIFEIPSYGWPEATILRYQILYSRISGNRSDIFVYLDADMLLEKNPWKVIRDNLNNTDICLVEHPGYWRPHGKKRLEMYLKHPQLFLSDLKSNVKYGALGQWENRERPSAFGPRAKRETYYCGGIWFGRMNQIKELMSQLSSNVVADQEKGIMAVWHDESHLNSWAVNNLHGNESPILCFDTTYPQLTTLNAYIHAVRKNN